MNRQNQIPNPLELIADFLAQVPQILEDIQYIKKTQQEILNRLEDYEEGRLGDYITEEKAQKVLGKKKSWFSNLRIFDKFPFTKLGSTVWYKKDDLLQLLHNAYTK